MSKNNYFQDFENMTLESTTRSHAIDHMISMAQFDYAEIRKFISNNETRKSSQKFVD
jgi:hypothetical protein